MKHGLAGNGAWFQAELYINEKQGGTVFPCEQEGGAFIVSCVVKM
jgi:hypothetical protein